MSATRADARKCEHGMEYHCPWPRCPNGVEGYYLVLPGLNGSSTMYVRARVCWNNDPERTWFEWEQVYDTA